MHLPCIVVDGQTRAGAPEWQKIWPEVRYIAAPGQPVPRRREIGIRQTSSEYVALLEDTTLPGLDWAEAILTALREPATAAVGGPIILGDGLCGRGLALACSEYGRFHPARFNGPPAQSIFPTSRLPGNNLAYRRGALVDAFDAAGHGLIEGEVNQQLRSAGQNIVMHLGMSATYATADHDGGRLAARFQHGRLYAGMQVRRADWATRIGWLGKSLLLPLVLSARSLAAMTRAVPATAWPKTCVWICLMESAWAVGEAVGYLLGAGDSLENWR